MTSPQFSRPGAIDLSALRPTSPPAGGVGSQPAGSWVVDIVGEEALRAEVLERSMSVVVLVSFWSEQDPSSAEINASLARLSDEFGGRFVLARLNVDQQPELMEALRIPQVPLVVAALRGQLAPLIQQPLPDAELRVVLDQVLQAAAANGITGTSPPLAADSQGADEQAADAEPESRYPEAENALMAGDLDTAIAEYEKALSAAPADDEAALGLAQAQLLKRTQGVDAVQARADAAADPSNIAAQLLVADLDLVGGHVEDAFGRLIDVVRRTAGDDRDAVRQHLIGMFNVVGDADPRVGKARSMLASALF